MTYLKKRTMVLIQLLLMLCCMVATGEAANKTLRDTAVNIDTYAKVDDATSALTGLNSFYVDGIERGFQQWFWYRVGPSDAETSLDLLPKKIASIQPTSTSLQTSYTLAGQFDISLLYELTPYPSGVGKASLKKTVTITNTSGAELDYHLFEYSDYDLSDDGIVLGDNDNIEIHNNKVYQNGSQSDFSGVTYTHESTLPPSSFDLDDGSSALKNALNDIDPSDFSNPLTPYGYGSDRQFVKQWDLTIPASQSVTFTITDSFYPTKPVTATLTSSPACVSYGGQTSYTIAYDNLLNTAPLTENLTAVKLIDFLPKDIAPANNPPTVDSVYDATANTVTWDLPNLAPGAVQQTKSLTVTVNSTTDFTNEILLVSEQAFPTRVPLQDPLLDPIITNTLCNHPPSIADVKDVSVNEGSSFSVQAQAFPNDTGQALTYSLNGAPAGMSISATGLISYPVAVFGVHTVTVTVTDNGAGALTASDSFILTVNKLNKPPVINSSAPTTANITQPYTYTIIASDPDNDTLTYGLYTSPPGMTMVGNVISWTPLANQAALWPVRVFAKDGKGGEATQDFNINVSSVIKQTPTITWAVPAAITYNTALSATQLNASASVSGSFAYTPASGTILNAGNQNLSVVFTPTDTTNYNIATAAVTLTVNKAAATVTLSGLTATYDGTAKTATATTTPPGKTVAITYAGSTTAPTAAGSYAVAATVSDANYSGSANGTLTIAKATPTISWATPAAVYIGTPLSTTQLNATANVNGSFVYTPVSGTLMNTAGNQTLSVTFSPTDTANYTSATASVVLAVNSKITPIISWATPAAIMYGTALSANQLNAAVSGGVAGTFTYSPALGTVLNAGSQTLSVTFTPTNTTTYNSATAAVTLTVNKAAATVALFGLTATYDGTAKAATATTNPAGKTVAITYAGNATAPTAAGSYAVVATVSDANYSGSASGTLVIAKATPTISWATPVAIGIGTALTSSQLNATASVPGSFVYTPPAGSLLPAGSNSLSVAFTPADAVNYNSASATVSITVNSKQTPVITWATPATITYGTALSAAQLNASANVPGSFAYTPAAGTVPNVGTHSLNVVFTPTDAVNYNTASATVSLNVTPATPAIVPSGDVSGDGKVDISDALLALKMSIGLLPSTAFNLSHADVGPLRNFKPAPDGKIDIEDVIVLLLRAVGKIDPW